jgi:hypothetical protein
MKLIIFLLSLLFTLSGFAQSSDTLGQLLKTRDFAKLNHYVSTQKGDIRLDWDKLRTIVGDYREGSIRLEQQVSRNGYLSFDNYWIDLLATKDKIFYYKFTKTDFDTAKHSFERTIDSLFDNNEYAAFEKRFEEVYNAPLNRNDLFLNIVYGSSCGIAGTDPEYMEHLDRLLQYNHIDTVRQWLQSANAEKQLYALLGYRKLMTHDYDLTVEEHRLIPIVEKKKGTVLNCSGCFFTRLDFQTAVKEINSLPPKYLRIKSHVVLSEYLTKKVPANASLFGLLAAIGVIVIIAISYFTRERK